MTELSIFRPLTQDETMDIIPLNSQNYLTVFLKELAKVSAEFQKKLRPFDSYNAKIDFEESVKTKANEISKAIDKKVIKSFDFGDLHRYGNIDRFEFIESVEQQNTRLVAGIKQEVVMGKKYKFKCKQRGNRISIFVKNEKVEEFEKWLNDVFLKQGKAKEKVTETKKKEAKLDSKKNKE